MKILMVLFRSLGDVCMGTTVVRAVKAKYPDAQIDFMTEKQNVNTLEDNPDITNIIVGNSYFEALDICSTGKYDKIYKLNMINQYETAWHHIPELQNQHLVEWYGKKAEVDVSADQNIYVYPSEKDLQIVSDLWSSMWTQGELKNADINSKVIAIHTSSGQYSGPDGKKYRIESKDWPMMYFEVLSERLHRNGYTVIQIGSSEDRKIEYENCVDLTGKLSFKQTLPFLKNCAGYIGVDSGPAYLAGQSGVPALLVMGATQSQTEQKKGPSVGPRNNNVVYINAPKPNNPNCNPVPCYINCVIGKQGGCILDVTTNEVWNTFKKMVTNE